MRLRLRLRLRRLLRRRRRRFLLPFRPPALTCVLCLLRRAGGGRSVITIPTFAIVGSAIGLLIAGTVFNIKKRNMPADAEAVPFINFWRSLPGLVMEGTRFSYHHGREFSLMVSAKLLQTSCSTSFRVD